jgi:hypothetical protein
MESLPPEMLNRICKYLDWKDVNFLEKALPQLFFSGAKLDVFERSLKKLKSRKNDVAIELQSIHCDLLDTMTNHFYLLLHAPYVTLNVLTFSQEVIKMIEEEATDKGEEKLKIQKEIKEINKWWRSVYLHQ